MPRAKKAPGGEQTLQRPGRPGSIRTNTNGTRYTVNYKARHRGTFDTVEEAEAVIDELVAADPITPYRERGVRKQGRGGPDARAVRVYLEALSQPRPRAVALGVDGFPARSDDPDVVARAADALAEAALAEPDVLRTLTMSQRVIDLRAAAYQLSSVAQLDELADLFVLHAKAYAERAGISRDAFRALGVPIDVLDRAGI